MIEEATNEFKKFPAVESFGHMWRNLGRKLFPKAVTYNAKIKLHGTNGAVRIAMDGTVAAQSRSRDITPEDDNAGFAAQIYKDKNIWSKFRNNDDVITYFGEWAGKGIQKNDAVTLLDRKYFFVFAIQVGDTVYTDPEAIENCIPDLDYVMALPWFFPDNFVIDFVKQAEAQDMIDSLNDVIEQIGIVDPFIRDVFGIEGVGEGLVVVPVGPVSRDEYSNLMFKAKSEAHRVKKTDKALTQKVEIPSEVTEFVAAFVTDARCDQGLTEACDGVAIPQRTPDFLKWMGGDIKKESEVELEEMGLTWKDVSGACNKAAARWFMIQCNAPVIS